LRYTYTTAAWPIFSTTRVRTLLPLPTARGAKRKSSASGSIQGDGEGNEAGDTKIEELFSVAMKSATASQKKLLQEVLQNMLGQLAGPGWAA